MTFNALATTIDRIQPSPNHSQRKIDVATALKMRLRGQSYRSIAEAFGCSKQAVQASLKAFRMIVQDAGLMQGYVDNKCDVLDSVEARMVTKLLDSEKLEKASVNNLAYAISQLDHIKRLERGQSTENIDVMAVTANLETIQDQLAGLRAAKAKMIQADVSG